MKEWRYQLTELDQLKIPHCLFDGNKITETDVHGFSDASQTAYGAVLYVLTTYQDGTKSVNSNCSKALIKQVSLRRLALCGPVVLSRLVSKVTANLEINVRNIYLWTDSMIV